jgi:hypothetical protein
VVIRREIIPVGTDVIICVEEAPSCLLKPAKLPRKRFVVAGLEVDKMLEIMPPYGWEMKE